MYVMAGAPGRCKRWALSLWTGILEPQGLLSVLLLRSKGGTIRGSRVDFPALLINAFPEGGSALLTGLQPLRGRKLICQDLWGLAGHVSHRLRLDSRKF